MIVLRRQINSDVDQRATAEQLVTIDCLATSGLGDSKFSVGDKKIQTFLGVPILGLPACKLVTTMSDLSLLH